MTGLVCYGVGLMVGMLICLWVMERHGQVVVAEPIGFLTRAQVMSLVGISNIDAFENWMRGCTSPILNSGEPGYYAWDVSSFISEQAGGTPKEWD